MGPSGKSARRGTIGAKSGIVIILFSDLVGSTELLDRLGDDVAGGLRRKHFGLLRNAVSTHRGTEVKNLGDGLMATFPSAIDAVTCAIAMQQAVHRHGQQDPGLRVAMRIGLHAGEPLREHDDYFGSAVVLAKRLCDSAEGGDIIASELVQRIVEPRGFFRFEDRELPALKGGAIQPAASAVVWEPSDDAYSEITGDALPQPPEPQRRVPALIVTVAALVALTATVSVLVSNRDRAPQTAASSRASAGSGSPGGGGGFGSNSDVDVDDFDVDDFGWLNSLTGQAVITGTLSCSAPVPVPVRLEIELTQGDLERREKRTLQCDGKNPWAVVVGPFSDEDIGFDASLYAQGARGARLQDSSSLTLRSCLKIGTLDDDHLGPSAHGDVICGLAGDDTIEGGGGDDELRGFDGNDLIVGSRGDDQLTAGLGKDRILGGAGDDLLYGDAGRDVLRGGPGFDRCFPGDQSGKEVGCEALP
ncbi:MAG: hypothetical protein H0V97_01970 [Actinobacteria bacterium]|nr:hypothetical protein [Actinomycetota bacterium]